jgi:cell wall-associated NlpC family hydrolase
MPGFLAFLRAIGRTEIPPENEPLAPFAPARAPLPTSAEQAVGRALSVVGQARYKLGRGGRKPRALVPWDVEGFCDCSGFASWVHGLDRYQPEVRPGGSDWISTTSIYDDATGEHRMFRAVPVEEALPGDLVVYPSRYKKGVRIGIGHVGVIVARLRDGWDGLEVVDCAARRGPAIAHRSGELWARRGIVARRLG